MQQRSGGGITLRKTIAIFSICAATAVVIGAAEPAETTAGALLQRGTASYRAGRYAEAVPDLSAAAGALLTQEQMQGYVNTGKFPNLDQFETAIIYLTLAESKLGHDEQAREAVLRLMTAERIEATYAKLPLDADTAQFEAIALRLVPGSSLPRNAQLASGGATTAAPATQVADATAGVAQPPATTASSAPATVTPTTERQTSTVASANPTPSPSPATSRPVTPPPSTAPTPTSPAPAPVTSRPATSQIATTAETPPAVASLQSSPPDATSSANAAAALAAERAERQRIIDELVARERAKIQKAADERIASEKALAQRAAEERIAAERAAMQKTVDERIAAERLAAQKSANERVAEVQRATITRTGDFSQLDRRRHLQTLLQADAYASTNSIAQATNLYTSIINLADAPREIVAEAAVGLYRTGAFSNATSAFRKLSPFARGEEDLRYYNAVALFETGDYENAKHELACALPFIEVTAEVTRYRDKIDRMAAQRASK